MDQLTIRSHPNQGSVNLARLIKGRVPELQCKVRAHRNFAMLEVPNNRFRTLLRQENKDRELSISQPLDAVVFTYCGYLEQLAGAIFSSSNAKDYGEDHTNG
jgi:PP-loop superfamily ATP-utilizing enzyme